MTAIILASGSPRRKDFIKSLGLQFTVISPDVDETPKPNELPQDLVVRLAKLKAEHIAKMHPEAVVIAADTIVVLDGEILGKPKDRNDAKAMIKKLSGKTHEVLTGYTVQKDSISYQGLEKTLVTFANISDENIEGYVSSGECDDKSGSYAVQGLATMFVEKVSGSVSSVVGLPICQVRALLEKFGITPKFV